MMPSNACSRTIGLPRSDRYVNGIFSSPEPYRISFCTRSGSFANGLSTSKPTCLARLCSSWK